MPLRSHLRIVIAAASHCTVASLSLPTIITARCHTVVAALLLLQCPHCTVSPFSSQLLCHCVIAAPPQLLCHCVVIATLSLPHHCLVARCHCTIDAAASPHCIVAIPSPPHHFHTAAAAPLPHRRHRTVTHSCCRTVATPLPPHRCRRTAVSAPPLPYHHRFVVIA